MISIPGTFRRAKTNLVGPKKMQNDPLEAARIDIDNYSVLLSLMDNAANNLSKAVENVGAAPSPLLDPLAKFYSLNSDRGSLQMAQQFCTQVNGFKARLKEGDKQMESLHALVKDQMKMNDAVRESFTNRDLAWQTKAHYESKVESLRSQLVKVGASPKVTDKLAEKLSRNEEKKRESEDEFNRAMDAVGEISRGVLEKRWQRFNEILSKFCQYYVVVFDAASNLQQEFNDLEKKFRTLTPGEAFIARGQEIAANVRERVTKFNSGWVNRGGRPQAEQPGEHEDRNHTDAPDLTPTHDSNGGAVGSSAPPPTSAPDAAGQHSFTGSVSTAAATAHTAAASAANSAMAMGKSAMHSVAAALPSRSSGFAGARSPMQPLRDSDAPDGEDEANDQDLQRPSPSASGTERQGTSKSSDFLSDAPPPTSSRRRVSSADSGLQSHGFAPPPSGSVTRSRKKEKDNGGECGAASTRSSRRARSDNASPAVDLRGNGGDGGSAGDVTAFGSGNFGSDAFGGFPPFPSATSTAVPSSFGAPAASTGGTRSPTGAVGFGFGDTPIGGSSASATATTGGFGDWPSPTVSNVGGTPSAMQQHQQASVPGWPSPSSRDGVGMASPCGGGSFGQFPNSFGGCSTSSGGGASGSPAGNAVGMGTGASGSPWGTPPPTASQAGAAASSQQQHLAEGKWRGSHGAAGPPSTGSVRQPIADGRWGSTPSSTAQPSPVGTSPQQQQPCAFGRAATGGSTSPTAAPFGGFGFHGDGVAGNCGGAPAAPPKQSGAPGPPSNSDPWRSKGPPPQQASQFTPWGRV